MWRCEVCSVRSEGVEMVRVRCEGCSVRMCDR